MRRRIGRGQRRGVDAAADGDDDNGAPVVSRASTRPTSPTPSIPRSRTSQEERRPTVTVVTNTTDQEAAVTPTYATPTVPVYSSGSGSQPGSSTTTSATPTTSHDAHPDATPGDEPAYEYGSGLPPAYRRGEGMTEVRRGKMPMREVDDNEEGEGQDAEGTPVEGRGETDREGGGRRGWTALDAYAFSHEEGGEAAVTAHVATDDKQVLERLRGMRGAPEQVEPRVGEAPREEDVFGVEVEDQQVGEADVVGGSRAFPPPPGSQTRVLPREDEAGLPSPPAKTGAGAVARYGEADLSLPGYLEGAGHSDLGPSAPPDEVGPSAPPEELGPSAPPVDLEPSAPPIDDEPVLSGPSAPPESELLKPSAPPLEEDQVSLIPDMPHFERLNSSTPLLENDHR
ncbi:hypothetical protein FRC07_003628 [Ceratobasidium sp. 392]|nr:hypothetical protein FRC07_003628 [Ceratobasidium sp. 392]